MASTHFRVAAFVLAFGLVAACGGERSRAAARADTTGAVVTPDSAAMPVTDTARPSRDTTPPAAGDTTRKASTPSAKESGAKQQRKKAAPDTSHAARAQAAHDTTRVAKAESAAAAVPPKAAPTPSQQDTSKAAAAAPEAPLRDAYHQAPHDTVSAAVYDGWKQFNLNCARCHGEDALGTTLAPHLIMSLKPDGPINTKELFMQTVCAGRPTKGMPSWCALGLGMDKINNIYLYVKGRSDAKIAPGRPAVKPEG